MRGTKCLSTGQQLFLRRHNTYVNSDLFELPGGVFLAMIVMATCSREKLDVVGEVVEVTELLFSEKTETKVHEVIIFESKSHTVFEGGLLKLAPAFNFTGKYPDEFEDLIRGIDVTDYDMWLLAQVFEDEFAPDEGMRVDLHSFEINSIIRESVANGQHTQARRQCAHWDRNLSEVINEYL